MPLQEINQSIKEILEPLREQLRALDQEISTQERALVESRQARRELVRVLSVIDPSSVTTKKQVVSKPHPISDDTVETILHRLRTTPGVDDNGGFTNTSLRRDHGFGDITQSTLARAITALHERGLIRLDHRGRGGAFYFKLVA